MPINRRSFLQALGLVAASVALSPMLDLAPIVAAPSIPVPLPNEAYVAWYTARVKVWCQMPARCVRMDGILGMAML